MKRTILAAVVMLAVGVGTASADPFRLTAGSSVTVNYLGINGCAGCVNTSATVTFALAADGRSLTLTLTNTGTDGLLTGLAFDSTPILDDGTPPDLLFGGFGGGLDGKKWLFNHGGMGVGGYEIGMGDGGSGLAGNESGVFWGTLTGGGVFDLNIDPSIVHFQRVAAFGGGSIKPGGCVSGSAGCPPVPVPEPASILLLGTGLLGAGFLRRRRK